VILVKDLNNVAIGAAVQELEYVGIRWKDFAGHLYRLVKSYGFMGR
jgi:hypothetical protein